VGSTATCNSGTVTTGWCKGGTATSGNQDGMFNTPAGLALDPSGTTLYVVDNGNNRVQRFDAATGAFKKWTGGVGSSGGSCTAGPTNGWCSGSGAISTGGSGDGYLSGPTGIAVDANYLYVGDGGNQRIVRFVLSSGDYKDWTGKVNTNSGGSTCPASGNYTGGWCTGGNVTATADTGVGGVNDPRNLAVDSAGNLWVAESWVYQVEQFNAASGQGIKTLGLLDFGIAVAVDLTATYLFAADTSDNFSRFAISTGTLAGTIGPWAAGTPPTGGQDSCPAENLSAFPTRWCTGAGQTWSFFQDTDLYGIGGAAVDPAGHYLYYTNRGSFGVVRVPIDQ
jgi:DNA-binding beta-propeller fold protein YncE